MAIFALATLTPALQIALAALWGGLWALCALLYMTLLAMGLDALVARVPPAREGQEFPAADALSALLAVLHFALLPLSVAAVAGMTGTGGWARAATGLAAGMWFGQVSHPNAHELIHRGSKILFSLGKWTYISLLIGHHTSAHRLVHHRHVGLPADPNTPRRGEGFYGFFVRAWIGSFRAGLAAERALGRRGLRNPYLHYGLGAAAMLLLGWLIAGSAGVLAWLALAFYAQMQLFLSDYVQHYGLTRRLAADGRPAPVDEGLSWNTPHWFTSHLMLNAPRHSDHHAHPGRPYPALRLAGTEPMLPASLPVMAGLAMVPPLWKRVMARQLKALGR